jgi:glycosyltransferase involved in cell wall biosynthesis
LSYDVGGEGKTTAVRKLVDVTREFSEAKIIGLDRVARRQKEISEIGADGYLHIKSLGLPYGLLLIGHLQRAHKKIQMADSMNLINLKRLDIIHAHKLTYEGYIGYLLARQLNKPLLVSLRQTDFYVLKYRRDLIPLMKKILKFSHRIFYIMPYMVKELEKLFGEEYFKKELEEKLIFLPNIIDRKCNRMGILSPQKYFFTALRMTKKSVKRKNIKNFFKALKNINDMDYELRIAGSGPYLDTVQRWSGRYGISHKLEFLGPIPNTEMDRYYAESLAFVMPSFSETFGMVYAEALINGTPILYSKDTGFDGLFENVGVAVNPHSRTSIEQGLREIVDKNASCRKAIKDLKKSNAFHIFGAEHAKDTYSKVLETLN